MSLSAPGWDILLCLYHDWVRCSYIFGSCATAQKFPNVTGSGNMSLDSFLLSFSVDQAKDLCFAPNNASLSAVQALLDLQLLYKICYADGHSAGLSATMSVEPIIKHFLEFYRHVPFCSVDYMTRMAADVRARP